jgi:phosphoribosyl-ATP pyrophosphohydrolase
VLWGRQGRDLDFSAGSPWFRVCTLGDLVAEGWRGDRLDIALNAVVYPVRDGHLGVYSLDTFVELAEQDDGWIECARRAWDGFAQCVGSADGSHVLALGSEGSEEDHSAYVRVVRLDDDKTTAYATTEEIAEPTALAVSNDAQATVAYVAADLVLHILTLTGKDLAHVSVKLG